jgi:1-acyl-sn-glycerol-3-phosphate acyltransferase/membrane protein YqaA with SNARE-associated domain
VKRRTDIAAGCLALARKALWRGVLTATGGLRVRGTARLPEGPCVIVANHNSHADTAALIAALPARRRPAVAAAADYWFDGSASGLRALLSGASLRPWACQALCGAFPVRRGGGGTADLEAAARLLAAGRDVVVYPEGSRSRDGTVGVFRHGAARLAATVGVPLVPAGITGTRALLPPAGTGVRRSRACVTVRIGVPVQTRTAIEPATGDGRAPAVVASNVVAPSAVATATDEARAQVIGLSAFPEHAVLRLHERVAAFAASWGGLALVAGWAFGEALSWPFLPELPLAVLCVAAPRAGIRVSVGAAIGSVTGGVAGYLLAAHGITLPEPVTTARMHAAVAAQVTAHGAAAVLAQPLSGIPFKVYVAASGARHVGLARFLLDSVQARGARILAAGLVMTGIGACIQRWRRFYPAYLLLVAAVYLGGWAAVVASWSQAGGGH